MIIEGTQFLRPNGEQRAIQCEINDNLVAAWTTAQKLYLCLHAEVLLTGQVSVTLTVDGVGDYLTRVTRNGPEVRDAVEAMLTELSEVDFQRWYAWQLADPEPDELA